MYQRQLTSLCGHSFILFRIYTFKEYNIPPPPVQTVTVQHSCLNEKHVVATAPHYLWNEEQDGEDPALVFHELFHFSFYQMFRVILSTH